MHAGLLKKAETKGAQGGRGGGAGLLGRPNHAHTAFQP